MFCQFLSALELFYYRDVNNNLRIGNEYSRDAKGSLVIDNDEAIEQLIADSSLSSLEKLDMIDSL